MNYVEFNTEVYDLLKQKGYRYISWPSITPETVGHDPRESFGHIELIPNIEKPMPIEGVYCGGIDDDDVAEAAGGVDLVYFWVNKKYL